MDNHSTLSSPQLDSPTKKRRLETTQQHHPSISLTPKETLHIINSLELCQLFDGHNDCLLFKTQAGEIQRNIDVNHLNELKHYQHCLYEKKGYYSFSTQIVVAEYNGKYALVDGQHRLETIKYLLDTHFEQASHIHVPVLTVQLSNIHEYDELFTAINKNKPVVLYKNVYEWKQVGKHLENYFMTNYHTYLKQTSTPQVPHINIQALLTYIDEGNYVQKMGLSYEEWIHEIETLNTCYRLHWRELLHKTKYISNITNWAEKCEQKCPERPLYLGVFRKFEWVDRILLKVTTPNSMYLQMKHVPFNFRMKIKKPMRREVWKKRNQESITGHCYACHKVLHYDAFECGHVVSVFYGGATTVNNLEPICRLCNADMGIEHLDDFKKSLQEIQESI